ncbi:phage integrase SAM-like domain-containing protein [Hymenobacter sp. M29]|uniref:Phage integrase SAM-like domain-containing protein n=1 Tax=Hymenobacter mellowenesis TaxID=3063995 RepID=A0ABT9A9D0_9BACT|nr:phage integrase SAM-like domain-containing protein [Hymenobacter sp. M29]MDO7846450.1 phage integrase SAM-like domain-containing protein [Hymenobacter sp. M29]
MPGFTFRQLTSRPLADGRCRVVLDVAWSEQKKKLRAKLPTGVRTLPVHFNAAAKPGRIISTRDPNSSALNERLTSLLSDVQKTFTLAETLGQPVTPEQLHALGNKKEEAATSAAEVAPSAEPTFAQLYQQWKDEHPHSTPDALRRYQQVVDHLERYHHGIKLAQVTRAVFIKYTGHLQGLGLSDTTVVQHVRFLRNCFRISELHIPSWLTMRVRFGRAVTLQQDELGALRRVELDPVRQGYLIRERERLLFQTQMLVRDSDLRRIQPHHVTAEQWPGRGTVLVLSFHQKKTGDQVRFPMPPLAASIWQRWEGKVPLISQQKRNEYMKELAQLAGLERVFVRVRFKKGVPVEEPLPLWRVISTHTPRHTGADMVLWGSYGDQNLKEVALGHLAGASVYGYDTLTRYGPLLLDAWARVGATAENAPTAAPVLPGVVGNCVVPPMAVRPVLTRFVG